LLVDLEKHPGVKLQVDLEIRDKVKTHKVKTHKVKTHKVKTTKEPIRK